MTRRQGEDDAAAIRKAVEVEVRYAETDQMGVVHHSNYVIWFELARTSLCAESGWHYAQIEELGYLLMVTRTETRHVAGAHYGDTVEVEARVDRRWSRGVRFAYRVRRGDTLLATGATDHVWVDRATRRPCRTPEPLRAGFAHLAGDV
ncbi:MAG: thioesterase family protein [Acidobacteriota bacterium]